MADESIEYEAPALGPETTTEKTWFEVRVLDIYGKPVDGIPLTFTQGSFKEKTTTNGAGIAKWKDVEGGSFAKAALDPKAVRDALKSRWGKGDAVEGLVGEKLSVLETEIAASLMNATPGVIVLYKPLKRVRLAGMHFDTNKCFLRESAMTGIRSVVQVYKKQPNGKMLVLGHTDTTADDAYNLDLSVERAEAVKAYLKDDVTAWDAWFDDAKPKHKRWGNLEVHHMIAALPADGTVAGFQAWSNDTRGTDLKVDGIVGPKTRKALIEAYMAIDATTVPKSVTIETHGCGEFFPIKGASNDENRRVEIYCFDDEITPPVPGPKASKGEPQYEQWKKQVTDDIDVSVDPRIEFRIRLTNVDKQPMASGKCRLSTSSAVRVADADGWVDVDVPAGTTAVTVEWEPEEGLVFTQEVLILEEPDPSDASCVARLRNLGFTGVDAADATRCYQRYFGRDVTGLLDDIREELIAWHDGGQRPEIGGAA